MSARKPEWKQGNPRDQVVALLMGVEGKVHNLLTGVYGTITTSAATKLAPVLDELQHVQNLVKNLPPGEWDKDG
jgi:hypothetical protein